MKNIVRRIQKLQEQLMPGPPSKFYRRLHERLETGRRWVTEYNEAYGLSDPSDEGLPPKEVHTSHGGQLLADMLAEYRERARLRPLGDERLRLSDPPATGGE